MKKVLLLFLIGMMGWVVTFAQNNVTLTFSCQTNDGGYVQPESIIIENLTRNWVDTIYYPDTVCVLDVSMGVSNISKDNGVLVLPNPFDGTTQVNVQSSNSEKVKIRLTDMRGRVCAEYDGVLQEGVNIFNIALTTPQTYVLSVQTASGIRSLKMENVGCAGSNRISCGGITGNSMPLPQLKNSLSNTFQLGDELGFTAYVRFGDTLLAHQLVTRIVNADEHIVITFPVIADDSNLTFCQVSSFKPYEIGFGNTISHVQDFDGNLYPVVQIGNQCWIKENLRSTHYTDGTTIPSSDTAQSITAPYRYAPDNNEDNVLAYGYLYNWPAVMHGASSSAAEPSKVQGICPTGWHVPSSGELSFSGLDGKALADSIGWMTSTVANSVGNNPSLNNSSGFSIRPAGTVGMSANNWDFVGFGRYARFWSTVGYGNEAAYCYLNYDSRVLFGFPTISKSYGLSIRCVRDDLRADVVTDSVIITSDSSVILNGTVLSDNGNPVLNRGFYGTTSVSYPTAPIISTYEGGGTGVFHSSVNGIPIGIPYSVRAFAYNDAGWSYGEPVSFIITNPMETLPCPNAPTVTDYDGNVYNTVQIGSQCWMKENLRTTSYSDGTPILLSDTSSMETACRYYPGDDSSKVLEYGYLYNRRAVMNEESSSYAIPSGVQGVCPTGWHVPSSNEWNLLKSYVAMCGNYGCGGDNANIAKALVDSVGWSFSTFPCAAGNDLSANNATGFGARAAGQRSSNAWAVGWMTNIWSASDYSSANKLGYNFVITANDNSVQDLGHCSYSYGLSVRCIRN